jgi:probable HAF family extracellular repeat protein
MKRSLLITWIAALALATVLASLTGRSTSAAGTPYTVKTLSQQSTPCDMSTDGRVVGEFRAADGSGHAFYWNPDSNTFTDLTVGVTAGSRAVSVNRSGVVLGWTMGAPDFWIWDALYGRRSLDAVLPPASGWVVGQGVNLTTPQLTDGGLVAGSGPFDALIVGTGFYNGERRAYVAFWRNSVPGIPGQITRIVNLGALPGWTPVTGPESGVFGTALSASGNVAGALADGSGSAGFFIRPQPDANGDGYPEYYQSSGGGDENALMRRIDVPAVWFNIPVYDGFCWFLNGAGQVALPGQGTNYLPGTLWNEASPTSLITLPGGPAGINDAGWLCGTAGGGSSTRSAWVRRPDGVALDLGSLGGGWSTCSGGLLYPFRCLNNANQVVGSSRVKSNGDTHAFIWADLNGNGAANAGEMRDLNSLIPKIRGTLLRASHINDQGQITGTLLNGNTASAYRLDPTP